MINLTTDIFFLALGTTSGSGAAAIGYAAMQQQQPVMNSSTLVPIGILLSGIALSATLAWKSSSMQTRLEMKIEQLEEKIKRLEDKKCCKHK